MSDHLPDCFRYETDSRSATSPCICDRLRDAMQEERERITTEIRTGPRVVRSPGNPPYLREAMHHGSLVRYRRVLDVVWGDSK